MKEKKKGSKLKTVLIVLLALAIIGAIFGQGEDDTQKVVDNTGNTTASSDVTKEATPTTAPVEEVITLTSSDLMTAYKENEVKADNLYKNKKLEITGTVKSIGKDIFDSVYITLSEEEYALESIQCYFKEQSEIDKVAELKEGDTVTVIGTCEGGTLNVLIKKCKLK